MAPNGIRFLPLIGNDHFPAMNSCIVISGGHPCFRQSLLAEIKPWFRTADILEVETLAATLEVLERRQVGLVMLSQRISDSRGLAGLMIIKCCHPKVPVIVAGARDGAESAQAAIQSGASGYIVKSAPSGQIRRVIEQVIRGETAIPASASTAVSDAECKLPEDIENITLLTPTQLRVLGKMTAGLLNKQIAWEMGITEATVKSHVTAIFRMLKVRTRTQAVLLAIQ